MNMFSKFLALWAVRCAALVAGISLSYSYVVCFEKIEVDDTESSALLSVSTKISDEPDSSNLFVDDLESEAARTSESSASSSMSTRMPFAHAYDVRAGLLPPSFFYGLSLSSSSSLSSSLSLPEGSQTSHEASDFAPDFAQGSVGHGKATTDRSSGRVKVTAAASLHAKRKRESGGADASSTRDNEFDASEQESEQDEADEDSEYEPKTSKKNRKKAKQAGSRECPHAGCGTKFPFKSWLKRHMTEVHTASERMPFPCSYCDKSFARQSRLKDHEPIHTGEKPYKCQECGKAFTRKSILSRHKVIHTGEKPYKCGYEGCEAAYIRNDNLMRHKRTMNHK